MWRIKSISILQERQVRLGEARQPVQGRRVYKQQSWAVNLSLMAPMLPRAFFSAHHPYLPRGQSPYKNVPAPICIRSVLAAPRQVLCQCASWSHSS